MLLRARAPDAAAFAPYGEFLLPPTGAGERAVFSPWLEPVPGRSQQCHLNRVRPSELPMRIDGVERHPHAAQLFLPVGVSRYLVTVMPSNPTGLPDPEGAVAFIVPGDVGVAYRAGTWHSGIATLDVEASFAVFMWRGGDEDDEFASIAEIEVHPPVLPTVPATARG